MYVCVCVCVDVCLLKPQQQTRGKLPRPTSSPLSFPLRLFPLLTNACSGAWVARDEDGNVGFVHCADVSVQRVDVDEHMLDGMMSKASLEVRAWLLRWEVVERERERERGDCVAVSVCD